VIHKHCITVHREKVGVGRSGNKAVRYKIIEERQLKEKKRGNGKRENLTKKIVKMLKLIS